MHPAPPPQLTLQAAAFDGVVNDRRVQLLTLRSDEIQAAWCNHGARLLQLWVRDGQGRWRDVVLGHDSLQQMLSGMASMGAFVGRYANRIAHSRLTLNGRVHTLPANDGPHCLHGGPAGSRHQVFDIVQQSADACTMAWTFVGEQDGFAGDVDLQVTFAVHDRTVSIHYLAGVRGQATPLIFTAHPFFNLSGSAATDVLGHRLQVHADRYVPVDATRIPLGQLAPVQGTPFDFRHATVIGAALMQPHPQLCLGVAPGYDHAFVTPATPGQLQCQAQLFSPDGGLAMQVWSDAPALQFYSGMAMDASLPRHAGKHGQVYGRHAGLCLEPQQLPDAPNQPGFGECIYPPGSLVRGCIEYRFQT